MDVSHLREEVNRILKTEPGERGTKQIEKLDQFFKNNAYFKEQSKLVEEKTIHNLFKRLRFA